MQQPAEPSRAGSFRAVALALAVVLAGLFVFVGLYRLLGRQSPPAVDAGPAFQAARAASAFPVASPARLPPGWRVLSADYQPGTPGATLRVALRARGGAVQLIESAAPPEALIPAELGGDARPEGAVALAGRPWQRYATEGGLRALVLLEPKRTIIVVGTASEKELRRLAGALT